MSDLRHPLMRPHLDPERLAALAPRWQVVVVDTSPSTHQALAAEARTGAAGPGTVLVAEHQTAGRGRLDRTWTTPARAALTVSLVVEPTLPDADWPWLPLLLGTSVAAGIEAAGGPRCGLKWPNDVMAPGRGAAGDDRPDLKVGGLLAERVERESGPAVAVLSLGLNVTTTPEELPVPTATSLVALGWAEPDRTTLLTEVLAAVAQRLEAWPTDGDRLRGEYAERCLTVGRHVRVERPGAVPLTGEAVEVARDGSLVVDTASGRRPVNAGDVVHVRPF
ncbi:biotin--[acetyl-CoA-carboxylase] ligase [Nocardioides sp. HDW12B]|uniref:biotin--[acetyl-CoA-carboxylase] ligase n=1 Tax=Nocardioides sp. HDW12B TaxID=2714939 RepID=UPI001F0FDF46|nr:biotin--[acetyl-CoA-carboxylase] ligase [Nocardioides sp. HDW12B]